MNDKVKKLYYPEMFAKNLRELRDTSGHSIEEVAALTGISDASLKKYEAGLGNNPSVEAVAQLAMVFHVSTDYLLGVNPGSFVMDEYREKLKDLNDETLRLYLMKIRNKVVEAGESTTNDVRDLGWPYNLLTGCGLDERLDIPLSKEQIDTLDDVVRTTLTPRETSVIFDYYKHDNSMLMIANENHVTPNRIRQIIAKAERKLRYPSRWKLIKYAGLEIEEFNADILEAKRKRAELIKELNDLKLDNELLAKAKEILSGLKEPIEVKKATLYDMPFAIDRLSVRSYNCLCRCCLQKNPRVRFSYMKIDPDDIPEWARSDRWAVNSMDDLTIGQVVYLFETGLITKIRNMGKYSIIEIADILAAQGVTDSSVLSWLGGCREE